MSIWNRFVAPQSKWASEGGSRVISLGEKHGPKVCVPEKLPGPYSQHGDIETKIAEVEFSKRDLVGREAIHSSGSNLYLVSLSGRVESLGAVLTYPKHGQLETLIFYTLGELYTDRNGAVLLPGGHALVALGAYTGTSSDFSGKPKRLVIAFPDSTEFESIKSVFVNDIELKAT